MRNHSDQANASSLLSTDYCLLSTRRHCRRSSLLSTDYCLLSTPRLRRGFTLLELLVVIVIIAVLVGLLATAVFKALLTGKQTRNRTEIAQLETALESFKTKYGVYPPSRLKLCEKFSSYDPANQLDVDSIAFLQKMFPHIDTSPTGIWQAPVSAPGLFIDWNGDGTFIVPNAAAGHDGNGAWTLEGDQVLVWALGGIPGPVGGPPTTLGFTTNPKNPADTLTPGATFSPPMFEFQTSRLARIRPAVSGVPALSYNSSNIFLSYLDNYGSNDGSGGYVTGSPYLYFSSYKTANGYSRYNVLAASQPAYLAPMGGNPTGGLPFTYSDCFTASLVYAATNGASDYNNKYASYGLSGTGTWPYAQSGAPVVYLKPNGFQIISAGTDTFFGKGSVPGAGTQYWTPAQAPAMNPQATPGNDDQGNFTGATLGSGQD
jgi:prepilin-type N-terminal cleavage/methylation domain-containing protein